MVFLLPFLFINRKKYFSKYFIDIALFKNMKKYTKKRRDRKVLKGGKYLGQGSYGCVITPEIECSSSPEISKTRKTSKSGNNDNKVSKLILLPDENMMNELDISKLLKKIDPTQKYFITFTDYCKVKTIPKDRNNVASVRYLNNNGENFKELEKKKLAKKFCPVDISKKPINLIMPFAGYNVFDIASFAYYKNKGKINRKDDNEWDDKVRIITLLKQNFKYCFKNLIIAVLKMHQHRIVARDIKTDNMTVKVDDNRKIQLRHIDFGLAEHLTPEYVTSKRNIVYAGTREYMPPEIFITYDYYDYMNYDDSTIFKNIMKDINKSVVVICKDNDIDTGNLKEVVANRLEIVKSAFADGTILDKYFGISQHLNGYLQKGDVYGLGMSIYEFIKITQIINLNENRLLNNLLLKMIEFDCDKRLNILQCLQHPYFT